MEVYSDCTGLLLLPTVASLFEKSFAIGLFVVILLCNCLEDAVLVLSFCKGKEDELRARERCGGKGL